MFYDDNTISDIVDQFIGLNDNISLTEINRFREANSIKELTSLMTEFIKSFEDEYEGLDMLSDYERILEEVLN